MTRDEATGTPGTFDTISARKTAEVIYMSYQDGENYTRDLEFDLLETGMSMEEYLEEVEAELDSIIGSNYYREWARNWAVGSAAWGAASIISFAVDQPLLGLGLGGVSLYGGKKALNHYRSHQDFMEGEPEVEEIMEALEVEEEEPRLILEP